MIFSGFTTNELKVVTLNIEEVPVNERLAYVQDVNCTLKGWDSDTRLIQKKYLGSEKNHLVFIVARLAEERLGYSIARKDDWNEKTAYLSFIAVKKSKHGQGVGTRLLMETIQRVSEQKFEFLSIDCEEKVLPFYSGFAEKKGIDCEVSAVGYYHNGDKKCR